MSLDTYRKEHLEAIEAVAAGLERMGKDEVRSLKSLVSGYLDFRSECAEFQKREYFELCRARCFSQAGADCCGRDAIAVFFADFVVNALVAEPEGSAGLARALGRQPGDACAYLAEDGCLFALKPVACEMFVCRHIEEEILGQSKELAAAWEELKRREKEFTWPSKPVLFDTLEAMFISAGLSSPLMYCHSSPGLMNLKKGWKR